MIDKAALDRTYKELLEEKIIVSLLKSTGFKNLRIQRLQFREIRVIIFYHRNYPPDPAFGHTLGNPGL